jgi:hypothetical protein
VNKIHKLKDIDITRNGVRLHIDTDRLERNLNRAQYALDSRVMTDMIQMMPKQTGTFINVTAAMSAALAGTGKVVAAAPPMGRFLYEGKVMVGVSSNSPFALKGEKKRVTDKALVFSTAANPNAQAHWFDATKENHLDEWKQMTKKTAGGGTR